MSFLTTLSLKMTVYNHNINEYIITYGDENEFLSKVYRKYMK